MAVRPAWSVKDNKVVRKDFDFKWISGLSASQKMKNADSLHDSIKSATGETVLEVSSKGREELGVGLSAFNLKYKGYYLENIFQSSKNFSGVGTLPQLLEIPPKEAKEAVKYYMHNGLESFIWDGVEWPLTPKTAFYDYIYVSAVVEKYGKDLDLSAYTWFTDIEFNPAKSINCQARALAIYKLLQSLGDFSALKGKEEWIEFHKKNVPG